MPTKANFAPLLLDPKRATPTPIQPKDGNSFQLDELYEVLGCQTVEVVELTNDIILIIDEEGKFKNPALLNQLATNAWYTCVPQAKGVDCIIGKAILCHDKHFD